MQINIFLTLFAIASTAVAHPHAHAHLHALRAAAPEAVPEAIPEAVPEAAPDAVPVPSETVEKRDGDSSDEEVNMAVELLTKPAAGIVVAPLKAAVDATKKGTDKKPAATNKKKTETKPADKDKKKDTSNKSKDDTKKDNTNKEQNIQDTTNKDGKVWQPKPSAKVQQMNCCCCDPALNKVVCKKIPVTQECFCLTAMCGGFS